MYGVAIGMGAQVQSKNTPKNAKIDNLVFMNNVYINNSVLPPGLARISANKVEILIVNS